jgi:hypothetical protein
MYAVGGEQHLKRYPLVIALVFAAIFLIALVAPAAWWWKVGREKFEDGLARLSPGRWSEAITAAG